jgi:hypothetical protein
MERKVNKRSGWSAAPGRAGQTSPGGSHRVDRRLFHRQKKWRNAIRIGALQVLDPAREPGGWQILDCSGKRQFPCDPNLINCFAAAGGV